MTWGRRLHDVSAETFEAQLAKVAADGFKSIQLAPTKSLAFSKKILSPGYARWLRRALDRAGLEVAILGSYFDLSAGGEEAEVELQKYFDHLLLAKWAGFNVVATETGKIWPDNPQYDERFDNVVKNTGRILEIAEKLGLTFAIEPVYGHTVYNADKMEILLERYPGETLRVLYDPVNLLDPNEEANAEAMWLDFIARLGERFVTVHVKDYEIQDGKKIDRAAGFGRMDHSHLLKLAEEKPHLDFLIEAAKDEQIPIIKNKFSINKEKE